jgi:hypothetical protein
MSLSFHRIIGQRAVNKTVQYDNRLTEFTNPPIHTGDLYVKRDLYVNGTANFTDIHASGNVVVDKNVTVAGTISASQFLPGQIIYMDMINISISTSVSARQSGATIFNFSYTPKNSNSYIIVEFQTGFENPGSTDDTLFAKLYVESTQISQTSEKWIEQSSRSGNLFPIVGKYTNQNTTAKNISVQIDSGGTDDAITLFGGLYPWLKITEIGR